jgi:hypothetical protein
VKKKKQQQQQQQQVAQYIHLHRNRKIYWTKVRVEEMGEETITQEQTKRTDTQKSF